LHLHVGDVGDGIDRQTVEIVSAQCTKPDDRE
jgi:hypothetical protein